MRKLKPFLDFIELQADKLLEQALEHIGLTLVSLFLAVLLGLPLGILITRAKKAASTVIGLAGVFQTIPSIALLGFMIPLLGIGPGPAIFALFLYALLPIIRNTYIGIEEVDKTVKEAALGIGMSSWQMLKKVELPLALPVIFAGIRTAAVINIGVATLASYIGAGGLGEFIFGGIALNNTYMMLAGAIPAALLALAFDFLLARLQRLKINQLKFTSLFLLLAIPFATSFIFWPYGNERQLLAGFEPEFMGRKDGYPNLKKVYGLEINTVVVGPALMYKAIHENTVDVISGYSTDGRVKALDLRVLKDNRNSFPPYFASAIINSEVAREFPEVKAALEQLSGKIDDAAMTEMNYQVDFLKRPPREVAMEFLKTANLYKPPVESSKRSIIIGSKIFTEQYILSEMFALLIRGNTGHGVTIKNGMGGTKICFNAMLAKEIDIYPEYSGTGLQVILQPPEAVIDSLAGNQHKVYNYVNEAFQEEYQIEWLPPLGFNNTYALMMREDQAEKMNIRNISELAAK